MARAAAAERKQEWTHLHPARCGFLVLRGRYRVLLPASQSSRRGAAGMLALKRTQGHHADPNVALEPSVKSIISDIAAAARREMDVRLGLSASAAAAHGTRPRPTAPRAPVVHGPLISQRAYRPGVISVRAPLSPLVRMDCGMRFLGGG